MDSSRSFDGKVVLRLCKRGRTTRGVTEHYCASSVNTSFVSVLHTKQDCSEVHVSTAMYVCIAFYFSTLSHGVKAALAPQSFCSVPCLSEDFQGFSFLFWFQI